MSTFKCKMCGGEIEFEQGATVGVCDSCGTKQTLPRLDDDRKANLYDRANHFRRNNDFDKAMGIYEQILNEDSTDAETYWSLVLCRYGIEYVEDPATHKRVPTVNRAQYTSIFDDDDYKSALKYADAYQRSIYEEEAKAINEIQKGILEISQKEEPFDVFICYKETDNSGRRTPDSVLANDLYHQLTQEGFKVFFSGITLEDKLGTAYEPYIFAALNSAKVMVVIGTKPEYFNAVWVKNEWSRYLALVKKSGGKKVLIPAYRDMDPYDLPEEFSHLLAQDMSKLGFMQDLIRGIKKIASVDEPKAAVKETVVVNSGSSSVEPLLKRAFMFLEDREWEEADKYCEKVLDIDPENAQAYLGKLMAECEARRKEELKNCRESFDDSSNFEKVVRFGDKQLVEELESYSDHIYERNELNRKTKIYNEATANMNSANTEEKFKAAAKKFESIHGFMDADEKRRQCLEKAEESRKDAIYNAAIKDMERDARLKYGEAISKLESIRGWRDADKKIQECSDRLAEIERKREEQRIADEKADKERRIAAQKAAEKKKRILSIAIPAVIAAIALVLVFIKVIIPNSKYNAAVDLMESGKYEEAIAAFEAMEGYKDSQNQLNECKYLNAILLIDDGKILEAYDSLMALGSYKDSSEKATEIYEQYCKEKLNTAEAEDTVYFGTYEQDNDKSNGKEKIEWQVLAKENNRLLVISKYGLNFQPYNSAKGDITWASCTLRIWLNGTFLNSAFSEKEQALIAQTTVTADKNPEYDTESGSATTDKVFLLSIDEANKYFSSDSARQCKPTAYAVAGEDFKGNCMWWLRTPGDGPSYAASVDHDGSVNYVGGTVTYIINAVRPVLWINLAA